MPEARMTPPGKLSPPNDSHIEESKAPVEVSEGPHITRLAWDWLPGPDWHGIRGFPASTTQVLTSQAGATRPWSFLA